MPYDEVLKISESYSVLQLSIDKGHSLITFCDFRYESGDHVAVFPTNDSVLVNKLGQILGVDLDVVISLNNLDGMALNAPHTLT